jgi:hypothetical protein
MNLSCNQLYFKNSTKISLVVSLAHIVRLCKIIIKGKWVLSILLLLHLSSNIFAQATFQSRGTGGRWRTSSSWTRVSGSDADGIPDANDNVEILAGDLIEVRDNDACNNLSIAGTLDYARNRTLTVNGNLSASGTTAEIIGGVNKVIDVSGSFTVDTGAILNIGISDIRVTGTSTFNGVVNFNQSHSHVFNSVVIAGTGTWNNTTTSNYTINGSLTNNGIFTPCSNDVACVYTLTNTSGTISGSSVIKIPDLIINSPASYSSTGSINITDNLSGTGSFLNSTNSTIRFTLSSPSSSINVTNFTASATGNTVIYSVSVGKDLVTTIGNTFYNLTIDNVNAADEISLVNDVAVSNQVTLTRGGLTLNAFNLILASGATASGGSVDSFIKINSTGKVRQNYVGTGVSKYLPIGNTGFSPIRDFTLSSAALGGSASIDFGLVESSHPSRDAGNLASGGDDDGTTAVSFIGRYWTAAGNNITSPAYTADLEYLDGDVTGTESDMIAALRRPITVGMSTFDDWLVAGTVNPTTNRVLINKGDNFGNMYAMDNTTSRLPIVLLSFDAKLVNNRVVLNWKTASETNNQFFTIERSFDGVNFEPIIFKNGAGNSAETTSYMVNDNDLVPGRVYYRLKQTDFNGAFEYSEIISVYVPKGNDIESSVRVFPNAVKAGEELNISIENLSLAEITIELISLDGSSILKMSKPLQKTIKLQIPNNLKSGYYILRTEGSEFSTTNRIIVQ